MGRALGLPRCAPQCLRWTRRLLCRAPQRLALLGLLFWGTLWRSCAVRLVSHNLAGARTSRHRAERANNETIKLRMRRNPRAGSTGPQLRPQRHSEQPVAQSGYEGTLGGSSRRAAGPARHRAKHLTKSRGGSTPFTIASARLPPRANCALVKHNSAALHTHISVGPNFT